jgi:type II secretory ATPase GspE/PulE/Tfp pilus assembly ATPase PilB-like protein
VFSTLHTNDAPTALTRLVDMGIEPYLVASSLEAVVAQRLVRVICPECKEPIPESEVVPLRRRFGDKLPATLYRGQGCRHCQGTGYRGRMGIFEMMVVTDDVRALILQNASPRDLRLASAKQGMTTLRDDGFRHLRDGRTTIDEVFRVTKDDTFGESYVEDVPQER